jgi:hypothetical protein
VFALCGARRRQAADVEEELRTLDDFVREDVAALRHALRTMGRSGSVPGLKERVKTPEALMQLLRDEAGLVVTRQRREMPTLIVRQR